MATLGNPQLIKNQHWHSGMTELNHLGKALNAKPHLLEGVYNKLFTSKDFYSDNPLSSGLMQEAKTQKEIGGLEWEWKVKGANDRPLTILENVMPDSVTQLGIFKDTYRIKLDEKWYVKGDIISPGTSNKKYQSRVQEDPIKHGDGWVYTLRLMSDDPSDFVPSNLVKPGTKWSKLYSQYEEAAHDSGSMHFSSDIGLRNSMSKFRKHYKVTDYASTEVLVVPVMDSDGKTYKSWIKMVDVEFWRHWNRELERGLWYTRKANSVAGSNGRAVVSGPGIQQQLEDSHIYRYNKLSGKLIEEYLMDIFYSRVKP